MSVASRPPSPVEVRRQPAAQRLEIVWSDGHRSLHDYRRLRGYCPCAACQGHAPAAIEFHPPAAPVDLVAIQPVGNYALSFRFSDGHGSGIYRFDFLRRLCPCPDCRPEGGDQPMEKPQ